MRYAPVDLLLTCCLLVFPAACRAADPYDFDRPLIYSVNPVGNGDFIGASSTGSDFVNYQTLKYQKCQEIGSRSARVAASWREIEPQKGRWDWSDLDAEMDHCARFGIEPVVLIVNIPGWVSPTGKPAHDYPPKEENAADFHHFITKLASRYMGRARYYEFWNEPNGWGWHVEKKDGRFLYNRTDEYIPWLYRCYKAIKAVDPDAQVAIGGLDNAEGFSPTFVRQSYEMRRDLYGGEKFWDAIADHPYNKKDTETDDRAIEKLEAIRAVAAEFGDPDIPLWVTEYGWNLQDTTPEVQERGTRAFLRRFAALEQSYLKIAQQLAIADFEPVHAGFGLCSLNLHPTPAFYAFQEEARPLEPGLHDLAFTVGLDGTVTLYGRLRAGLQRGGPLYVDVINEAGRPVASPTRIDLLTKRYQDELLSPGSMPGEGKGDGSTDDGRLHLRAHITDLPEGLPLLARFHYVIDGHRRPPVARLPILLPEKGEVLPHGDFEGLFRAGVPWGWRARGDLLLRNGTALGEDYVRHGEESLLIALLNNHEAYRFAQRLEIPLKAKKGERFRIRGHARLQTSSDRPGNIRVIPRLVTPDADTPLEGEGTPIAGEWTPFEAVLEAPADAPLLALDLHSPPLPRSSEGYQHRWFVVLDHITAEPLASSP